jgi:phage-related protein
MARLLESAAGTGSSRNTDICHQIQDEIYEFIQGRLRILWFYDRGRLIICSHGFVKKSQKTPRNEISRAIAEKDRYFAAVKDRDITIID